MLEVADVVFRGSDWSVQLEQKFNWNKRTDPIKV